VIPVEPVVKETLFKLSFLLSRYPPSNMGKNREKYGGAVMGGISQFSHTSQTVEERISWLHTA
jgi:hypothetical protein